MIHARIYEFKKILAIYFQKQPTPFQLLPGKYNLSYQRRKRKCITRKLKKCIFNIMILTLSAVTIYKYILYQCFSPIIWHPVFWSEMCISVTCKTQSVQHFKPIKCISIICSHKYDRKCDFACSHQLLVLCIIFYQCISAMICTLYSCQNYAFFYQQIPGKQVWNQSQHSERSPWWYCSFANKNFFHSVYIVLMVCFSNELLFLGKGSSSLFQTRVAWILNMQWPDKQIAMDACSREKGQPCGLL